MREKMPSPKSLFILYLQWIPNLQQHSIATSKWELEACPSHCRPAAVRSSTVNFSSDSSGFRTLCTHGHFFHIHFNFKMRAFWDIAPCILVEVDGRFTGPYCLHHQVLPPISARISKFVFSIKCPNWNLCAFFIYLPFLLPSQVAVSFWSYHPNNIWRRVQIMKLILQAVSEYIWL
jgi:hypothetical protein